MEPDTQGDKIRTQVEYYFSDENLQTDRFLEKLMKKKNLPVDLSTICDFKKMKKYPREKVEEALQDNPLIDLVHVGGTLCIQRRIPFVKAAQSTTSKSKVKPTGFEEYYTDPPIAPHIFSEEEELYASCRPFAERIETAIQRYSAKRRFSSHARNIFEKWMRYGGINAGPKMFSGGMDKEAFNERTAAEIVTMTATNYVGEDKYDGTHEARWAVDFEGIAKGFLSTMVSFFWAFDTEAEFKEPTTILRNFYNYILHHNVCPEYRQDVLAAREVCNHADEELFAAHKVMLALPGDFNTACSNLFGTLQEDSYASSRIWFTGGGRGTQHSDLSDTQCKQILALALAAYGSQTLFSEDKHENRKRLFQQTIIDVEDYVGMEVTKIVPASKEVLELYDMKSHSAFKPLGKLICKPWTPPDFTETDLPPNYEPPKRPDSYEFWMEQDILDVCFEGMKIEGTICTSSGGLTFLDAVASVKCSFYTVLENELTRKWKEPRWITREEQIERDRKWMGGEEEDGDDAIED